MEKKMKSVTFMFCVAIVYFLIDAIVLYSSGASVSQHIANLLGKLI